MDCVSDPQNCKYGPVHPLMINFELFVYYFLAIGNI